MPSRVGLYRAGTDGVGSQAVFQALLACTRAEPFCFLHAFFQLIIDFPLQNVYVDQGYVT